MSFNTKSRNDLPVFFWSYRVHRHGPFSVDYGHSPQGSTRLLLLNFAQCLTKALQHSGKFLLKGVTV